MRNAHFGEKPKVPEEFVDKSIVNWEDTLSSFEFDSDISHDSAREMWIALKFYDREHFIKYLAKFVIYNNFTLDHIKINREKVTALWKSDNCPWCIHASLVESGPHFKVQT